LVRRAAGGPGDLLGPRALNRATLARQHLLERSDLGVAAMVEHLVGLQAQAPFPPYYGLWSRLDGFVPDDLSRLLLDRTLVRIVVMRGTIHLVTADDCRRLRPWLQPVFDRWLVTDKERAAGLDGLDLDQVTAAGRALLAERPMTSKELGPALQERFPAAPAASLEFAIRNRVPLVQIPPRAIWGKAGRPTWAVAEDWLGRPLERRPSVERIVLRYLAAYGPATVADVQAWCGLTRLGEIVERLLPRLRVFRGEDGQTLYDVPDAPRPDPDTPAPVRFIAEFDNLLISYADRTRVISDAARKQVFTINGLVRGTVTVDGQVAATWKIDQTRTTATLTVTPLTTIPKRAIPAIEKEGARLLAFAAPGTNPVMAITGRKR
jgi:Winged helix DNA-binding domain